MNRIDSIKKQTDDRLRAMRDKLIEDNPDIPISLTIFSVPVVDVREIGSCEYYECHPIGEPL